MTLLTSTAVAVLAIIGSISSGVWLACFVYYMITKNKSSAEQVENKHLQERLIEAQQRLRDHLTISERDINLLKDELRTLHEKYENQQTLIVSRLLGS